ncbi:hypothetical protein AFV6_gp01 [Betalipothrixvirus pozzuoliense]|uniref:Uncharacterized protein n=1 Tax=Betalipothrixvirus pozzuoliense TaxID=346882 RepID=A7WKF6_9VIRU|nr:hypothetical protein AFV6_gp01 [Acidianus filamentous virus 6]CAJ31555.1 conserved hypothetical protein [Acidianus filamentous virus 6]
MARITHELRFIMGIYPVAGWLVGIEIHACYPSWYVYTSIIIFSLWSLYESIINYIQNGEPRLILIVNALGVISEIDLMYLVSRNFPIVILTGKLCLAGYVYLMAYLIMGIIVNIMDLKSR